MEKVFRFLEKIKIVYSDPKATPNRNWIKESLDEADGVFGSKQTQHDVMLALTEQERLYGEMSGEMTTELILIAIWIVTIWFLGDTSVYLAILLTTFIMWLLTKRRQTVMYTQIKHLQGYIDGCVETLLYTTQHLEKMREDIREETKAEPVVQ